MSSVTLEHHFWLTHQPVRRRLLLALLPLLALLAVVIVVGIGSGGSPIPYGTVARILLGLPLDAAIPDTHPTIVQQVRLPRVLVAALIGGGLAAAGVMLQGVFRNPLAAPGLLGVSTGGSAGAVLAIATGLALMGIWIVPLFALVGSLLAALLVYTLAVERGRAHLLTLILAGTAVNVFLGALISFVLLTSEEVVRAQLILNWLVGGLIGRSWGHVWFSVAPIALCIGVAYSFSRDLNLFLLGEETAQSLGTDVGRVRLLLLVVSGLLTGVCVSVTGPIGFVGLVVPHMLRLIVGPDHRVLLPASVLGGAIFLVLADTLARLVIVYQEVPVGVLTGLIGGPFFLFLIWRNRQQTQLL